MYGHRVFVSPLSAANKLTTTNSGAVAWKRHSYDERPVHGIILYVISFIFNICFYYLFVCFFLLLLPVILFPLAAETAQTILSAELLWSACKTRLERSTLWVHWHSWGFFHYTSPNVVIEWLTLLLRIREVTGSHLGQETRYPDWGFVWFSSVCPRKFRVSTLNSATTDFSLILSNSSFTCYPFIRRY
jgi:hypothetical protein